MPYPLHCTSRPQARVGRCIAVFVVAVSHIVCNSSPERRAERLYEQILRNESPLEAASILEQLGAAAKPYLLRLLEDDEDANRVLAARGLRRFQDEDVVSALEEAARNDPDPIVQEEAIRSLGYTGNPRAMQALRELSVTHWRAQSSLKRFDDPGFEILIGDFHAETVGYRKGTRLWVLCGKDSRYRETVRQVLLDAAEDPAWEVRASAARCFQRLDRKKAVAWLLPMLEDPVPEVRIAAAKELAELGSNAGVDPMQPLVENEQLDDELRARALLSMGRFPDESKLAFYRGLIYHDRSLRVRMAAAEAVRRIFPHHDDPEYEGYQPFLRVLPTDR